MDKQNKRQHWDQISLGWTTPNTPDLFLYEALYSWAIPLLAPGSDNVLFSYSDHQGIDNLRGN